MLWQGLRHSATNRKEEITKGKEEARSTKGEELGSNLQQ